MTVQIRQLLLALAVAIPLMLVGTSPALAHSELADSNPADGSTVQEVPAQITLTFNEPLQGTSAKAGLIIDGQDPVQVDASINGAELTIDTSDSMITAVTSKHPTGTWAVGYEVVSADGHPISGSLKFTVGTESPGATSTAATSDDEDSSSWVPVLVGIGALLAVAAVAAVVWRRSRLDRELSGDDDAT